MSYSVDPSQISASSGYQPAPYPQDEVERRAALQRYNLLDTLPEPSIDDLSKLAAYICNTPIALVSLVDAERQWFKSTCGIDATETLRDASFCAHAILQPSDVFVIPDARKDKRFAGNPLVVGEPYIRFYAGTPLVTQDGYALGSLCVIDRQPRTLSPAQIDALAALGRQVVDQFEARHTLQNLHKKMIELREAQLSAVNHAKMSALGYLVRGVAHEVNNPIGFIGSNLPHVKGYAEDALKAIELYQNKGSKAPSF